MTTTMLVENTTLRNIAELQWEVYGWLPEVWPPDIESDRYNEVDAASILGDEEHPFHAPLQRALTRLRGRWTARELGQRAVDAWFNQDYWLSSYPQPGHCQWALAVIVGAALRSYPPDDLVSRLEARIRYVFENPVEPYRSWREPVSLQMEPVGPSLDECLGLLITLPATHAVVGLAERITLGAFDAMLPPGAGHGRAGRVYEQNTALERYTLKLVRYLRAVGRLDFQSFCQAAAHLPKLLGEVSSRYRCGSCDSCVELQGYAARLAEHLTERLSPETYHVLKQFGGLKGSDKLVAAARHHATLGLGALVVDGTGYGPLRRSGIDTAVIHLARATEVEPADPGKRAALVAELRQYPAETLKALLPVAVYGRHVLCEALSWESALPLIEEIVRLGLLAEATVPYYARDDGAEDRASSVDPVELREAIAATGPLLAKEILALYRRAKVDAEESAALIEATIGWSSGRIERGLFTRNTNTVRAYGLSPLTRGEEEVQERYLRLHQFLREGAWFPTPRRKREHRAVESALTALARNAGYADATRLEWAMEARLAQSAASIERTWELASGHRVELTLNGVKPQLVVSLGQRRYKAVPPAVRRDDAYVQMKEAVEHLRTHATRVRQALERMLAGGEEITRAGLADLARLPVVATMLRALVGVADGGTLG